MRALALKKYGSLDGFTQIEIPTPEPKAGEVRVKVHVSAVEPADYKVAMGTLKFLHGRKFPMILGYDFSGVVDAVGSGTSRWKKGDSVFGFLPYSPMNNQGAYAEYVIVPSNQIALKPASVSHTQAAAAATAALTALQAIRDHGKLPKANTDVLITGVSGAVGSTGIFIARKLGARVTAVGSGRGLELARKLGAEAVLDRKKGDVVKQTTDSYNVILDATGAYRWAQWKPRLKSGGAFVTTLPSRAFAVDKLASLISPTRVGFVNVKSRGQDLELLAKWMSEGSDFAIDSTYDVRDVAKAIAHYGKGEILGRIMVNVESGF